MSEHTPDRLAYEIVPFDEHERQLPQSDWTGLYIGVEDDVGRILHTLFEGGFTHGPEHGDPEADARRWVACWNACAGIPTTALEGASVKALVEAANWAERALAPFSKEPAEQSGIIKLRAALAPFLKDDSKESDNARG